MVADRALVVVNRRGLAVNRTQIARGLAQRRAHAARELGQRRRERQALGGVAYVYDEFGTLASRCNLDMVDLKRPTEDEIELIHNLVEEHALRTSSPRGIKMLYRFKTVSKNFVKVIPRDYERVLDFVAQGEARGMSHADALQFAFDSMKEGK